MNATRKNLAPALIVLALGAWPTRAQGQAVLVEAYLVGAEGALDRGDVAGAARLYAQALADVRAEVEPALAARALLGAAQVHIQSSQFAEAKANVRAALTLGAREPTGAEHLGRLGLNTRAIIHYFEGEFVEAEALYARLIAALEAMEGRGGIDLGIAWNDMARVQIALGHLERAEALARAAMGVMEEHSGPDSANVAHCLDTLAQVWHANGRHEAAERLAAQAVEIARAELGEAHAQVGSHLGTLGAIQAARGDHHAGLLSLERSLAIQRQQRGEDHPLVANIRTSSARLREAIARPGEISRTADAGSPGGPTDAAPPPRPAPGPGAEPAPASTTPTAPPGDRP